VISSKCSMYFVIDSMWELEHILLCPVIVCLECCVCVCVCMCGGGVNVITGIQPVMALIILF